MNQIRKRLGQPRFIALGLAGALLGVGCSPLEAGALLRDDVPRIAAGADCVELQEMEGDPYFYGSATGFNCFLSSSSSDAVVMRYYVDPGSMAKVIDDWREVVNEQNQLVYSDNWFATGPAPALEDLFRSFAKAGPQSSAPPSSPMSTGEQNMTLCSSVTYEVMLATALGESDVALAQYFENYPGMGHLRDELLTSAVVGALRVHAADDDLRGIVFLTRFDDEIKTFCATASG